ncbi:MAG: TA system VapC family ribonuclease toxin [Dermatophilaceae bacterium]
MTAYLLDANVLISLTVAEHEHHDRASEWLRTIDTFAICPVVEGALMRFLLRVGESAQTATAILAGVRAAPRCVFWPDALSYLDADTSDVRGYRHLTDTYLVAAAKHHGTKLATFDIALAERRPEDCLLIA